MKEQCLYVVISCLVVGMMCAGIVLVLPGYVDSEAARLEVVLSDVCAVNNTCNY